MKSFTAFIKDEYLALESIYYHDEHLFKPICEGAFDLTDDEIEQVNIEQEKLEKDKKRSYLQNDQEVELIKIYQADPDSQEGRDALDKLVKNKMGLIYAHVNKHLITHPQKAPYRDDMVQNAALALLKAIDDFDVKSKNIFNAYAIRCIDGAIMNSYNPIREKSIVAGKVDDEGNPIGMTSVDQVVSGTRGEWADRDMTIGDLTPDETVKTPGDDEEEIRRKKLALIRDWISELPDREQKVMNMYFPQNKEDQKTLEEIGKEIKITKMGVKKLIDKIIEKFKIKAKAEKAKLGIE